jgi:hypothetical protein
MFEGMGEDNRTVFVRDPAEIDDEVYHGERERQDR